AEQNHSEHKESDNSLLIKANEYDFLPNSINVDVGETVTLSVDNTGTVEHDLEIVDFNPDNVQQDDSHNHGQNANSSYLHSTRREIHTVSLTHSEKDEYSYICTLPGHKESGMIGMMDVS